MSASFQKSKEHQNKNETQNPLNSKHAKLRYSLVDIDPLIEELLNHQSSVSDFRTDENNDKILAIFDDSCDEVLKSSSFANLATAGRHKGVSVIFIKHNLYHQGRYCVTVDINKTKHILSL